MIKCPSCGKEVSEGIFCEECGASLKVGNAINDISDINSKNATKSGGSFFDAIKTKANQAKTEMLAIKSDFSSGNVLYKNPKIPNVDEKKIKVEPSEIVYFNIGGGFDIKEETFTTTEGGFVCYFVRRETKIDTVLNLVINSKIKKVEVGDEISVNIVYKITFNVDNVDTFFNKLVSAKQDTWKVGDVNALLTDELNEMVINSVKEGLANDGNLNLLNINRQIEGFNQTIIDLINNYVSEYGMVIEILQIDNISTDVNEINKVLIDYIYNKQDNVISSTE